MESFLIKGVCVCVCVCVCGVQGTAKRHHENIRAEKSAGVRKYYEESTQKNDGCQLLIFLLTNFHRIIQPLIKVPFPLQSPERDQGKLPLSSYGPLIRLFVSRGVFYSPSQLFSLLPISINLRKLFGLSQRSMQAFQCLSYVQVGKSHTSFLKKQ